jgi:hypothetical protein
VNITDAGDAMWFFFIYEDQNRDLVINCFAHCGGSYCDWGVVPCIDYSDDIGNPLSTGFMAFYDFEWKETWVAATQYDYPKFPLLDVFDFHFYHPPDGRFDRWDQGIYLRID